MTFILTNNSQQRHDKCLERLLSNLHKIGEIRDDIAWIMHDGRWYKPNDTQQYKLCDLIIVKYDGSATAAELKGCLSKRKKARLQTMSGERFCNEQLGIYDVTQKFVVYKGPARYHWEKL